MQHAPISNIPNGDVAKGETIASYVQPFPAKGLGYQRVVFTLYKQNAKVDFSSFKLADVQYIPIRFERFLGVQLECYKLRNTKLHTTPFLWFQLCRIPDAIQSWLL
uniref:Uncharacterized protein n=1 Tax=Megaselia scalaris TaxID=36166 RepID=T1H235_MEGSC